MTQTVLFPLIITDTIGFDRVRISFSQAVNKEHISAIIVFHEKQNQKNEDIPIGNPFFHSCNFLGNLRTTACN
jgi:hypothetical protein